MTIADNIKLDFLWKKVVYGVTQTAFSGNTSGTTKQGTNESISSQPIIFNSQIWSQGDSIPAVPPTANTNLVDIRVGATALQCVVDPSVTGSRTWIVVNDATQPITDTNRLKDWISPNVNPSYIVKIYAGNPATGSQLLNSMLNNYEYVFDYSAGVVYFPNNVPSIVLSNGIYIEGYRYIGSKGGVGGGGGSGNINVVNKGSGLGLYKNSTVDNTGTTILNFKSIVPGNGITITTDAINNDFITIEANGDVVTPMPSGVEERNLSYTTRTLNPGEQETFTMNTCGVAIVLLSCLDSDSTVECHTTSQYTDSNPYAFKAYNNHYCDDGTTYGSSLGGIIRGPRFFRIHNMENFRAAYTFWRIINDSADTKTVTFNLRTLTFGF